MKTLQSIEIDNKKDIPALKRHRSFPVWQKLSYEKKQLKKNSELLFLALPGLVYKLIFAYLPMVGLILAFKFFRYDQGIIGSRWVGFANFEFFFKSQDAWRITRNTLLYNLAYIALGTIVALIFALLLNEIGSKMVKIYQTAMFLPYFISMVLVGYIAFAFLDHQSGILNTILSHLGMKPHKWYFEPPDWLYILPIVSIWKGAGFGTLVYYAGIIGISSDYYEAAKLDGASRIQMMTKITVPLLKPLIIILIILGLGSIFRGDFGLHYFVPNNVGMIYPTTDVIDTYVYRALTVIGDINLGSAVSFLQSVVGFVTIVTANYIIRKINHENALF